MQHAVLHSLLLTLATTATTVNAGNNLPGDAIDIGFRLEPLVDEYLIEKLQNARLVLHRPTPREVAIVCDRPWEGNICAYFTVFQDGDLFRMYYRGAHHDEKSRDQTHEQLYCYAESRDGIHWERPDLGVYEFEGSKKNNIVWMGVGAHNFAPFRDANPNCKPAEKYKAIGSGKGGLYTFRSADAIHWSQMTDRPVITDGAFDSQNLAFWDKVRGHYVDFHRDGRDGIRDIKTCTSGDFLTWTDPEWLDYGSAPREHLYTNAITPYPRAPHIFMGFPKRFLPGRNPAKHLYPGVSDGVFMTSRDGRVFRRWGEALIRPGPQIERWVNRNNMTAWGIVLTRPTLPGTPEELSIYSTESYYRGNAVRLRRFTLRQDGFVSVNAPLTGGVLLTKALTFSGPASGAIELIINYATSAAGSVRGEILGADGKAIDGFGLAECDEIYGDEIEHGVSWRGRKDVSGLAGRAIRLRFILKDADLYSIRFR